MQAAVIDEIGKPLRVTSVPVPTLRSDEVLIETRTCGICRTDLHIQDGLAYVPALPHVPGHEPAGVVAAIGAEVTNFKAGDRVAPYLFMTCRVCRYCRTGRDAQCLDLGGVLGVTMNGGFAEFFKAPARNLLPLPPNVPFAEGGLVSCAVITAMHAFRRARLGVNDVVAVLGVGGIGQILTQILVSAGMKVLAIGRSPQGLDLAIKAGAHLALAPEDATRARVKDFFGIDGVRCVFECVGTAKTMKLASDLAERGGQIIVIGEEAEAPGIETIAIAQRELEIIGSRNGSLQDAADALQMMEAGIIRPAVVRRFKLAEINDAFDFMRRGEAHGRIIIDVK
ncbi:MAG TPA: alcohol dehydrogenase catalytic domain-containing protein [Verrucomicrobiae bacterium]|jgi:propanol-preferring alcohol dehydrogenase|nr:alcohol dehydrogenase catalytic domain-containing protein [Verrucomicrobiae bacterium]